MTLSALSLPSFAGGIAGITSGLLLRFQGGFTSGLLSEFHIAGLLLRFQGGFTISSLSDLRSGQGSSLTRFSGQLGGFSLSDTGIARYTDRLARRSLFGLPSAPVARNYLADAPGLNILSTIGTGA